MEVSYKKLWKILIDKDTKKKALQAKARIIDMLEILLLQNKEEKLYEK